MRIKKIVFHLIWFVIASVSAIWFSKAEIIWISQSEWNSKPDSFWYNQECDEDIWREIYAWQYWLYLDNFENPASNPWPLYIRYYKVLTRWDYLEYNPSNWPGSAGNWLVIFNQDYLSGIHRKVNPWQIVRHLTTAEEVNWATFYTWWWGFDEPYVANDWAPYNTTFTVPNYRSLWTHPSTPTATYSNWYWDAEFRIITFYDSDDDPSTVSNNRAIVECQKNVIRWCGDWLLNAEYEQCDPNAPWWSTETCSNTCQIIETPTLYCWDGIINQDWEDCDPGSWNFWNGCSDSCKLMTPSCNLTANPNQWNIPLTTSINGTTNSWWGRIVYLNFGDGNHVWNGRDGVSFPQNHTYSTTWTFYLTWQVLNIYPGEIRTGVIRPVAYCSISVTAIQPTPVPYCWDGIVNGSEECDPNDPTQAWWNNNWYICNSWCQLVPDPNHQSQCNSTYNWTHYVNNPAYPDWLTENLDLCLEWTVVPWSLTHRWNWYWHVGHYSWSCSNAAWTTWCQANQQRCWDWIKNGNEQCDPNDPTQAWWNNNWYSCNSSCQLYNPGHPNIIIEKEQISTGVMTAWSTVVYRITVRNIGSWVATWVSIYDALPRELQYMTSSISIVPNSTYQFVTGTVQDWGYSRTYIRYFNITLNANWTATIYLTWKVKDWFTFDTLTNCATVSWSNISPSEDCVTTTPPTPYEPHLTINKELLTAWNITVWSTVAYKVTLTNDGNATYYNAYIDDVRPKALNYLTSSIVGVSNYEFTTFEDSHWAFHIKYYDFNLDAGRSVIVYLTWTLKQWFDSEEMTNCAMTSGAVDCEEFPLSPTPYLKKWQKTWGMHNFTDEIIQVELGEVITYKIDFWNLWTVWATWQVWDILPSCVKYVSSSIHLPNGISYSWPHTGQQWSQDFVMYKDFFLDAGQTWYMLVEAEIKWNWVLWLNCSDTTSYLNTWYFKFVWWKPLSSDVLAERPETPTNTDVSIEKTVDISIVKPWDTVTYTIRYTNEWPDTLTDYTIIDNWPSTRIRYETSSSQWQRTSFENGWNTLKRVYNNQNFAPWETRTITVIWEVLP